MVLEKQIEGLILAGQFLPAVNEIKEKIKAAGRLSGEPRKQQLTAIETLIALLAAKQKNRLDVSLANLANTLLKAKFFRQAEATYQQALALNPRDQVSLSGLADTFQKQGKFPASEATYKKALALNPRNQVSLSGLADTFQKQGKFPASEATYKKALALNPRNQVSLSGLASVFYGRDRFSQALELVERCLAIDAKNQTALVLKANILRRQKDFDQAITLCRQVLAFNSVEAGQQEAAKLCLGFCYLEQYHLSGLASDYQSAENLLKPLSGKMAHACLGLVFLGCYRAEKESALRSSLFAACQHYLQLAAKLDSEAKDLAGAEREVERTFSSLLVTSPSS